MDNILILDTSFGSFNRGDDIIMECVREELSYILNGNFELNLPTHIPAFHSYQIWKNSISFRTYSEAKYKFVGGSNLAVTNLLTHYPQWNVNIFNYKAFEGCVLVGVGVGAGDKIENLYTRTLYRKMLSKEYYHSCRDQRSKSIMESIGVKALNTGCVTMWKLTPKFCKEIPVKKANRVVFTLTASKETDPKDQQLIDMLNKNYERVYFFPQGYQDYDYLHKLRNIENIVLLDSTIKAYDSLLCEPDIEYVGTRLHGGIYAMRHKKRAIILVIDERAREINKSNNLNCIEKKDIDKLDGMINSEFRTEIVMPYGEIEKWKEQFK